MAAAVRWVRQTAQAFGLCKWASLFFVRFFAANIRHREFYARPNRMQKTVWPPPDFDSAAMVARQRTTAATIKEINNENNSNMTFKPIAGDNSMDGMQSHRLTATNSNVMPLQVKSTNTLPPHRLANNLAREQFYNGMHDAQQQKLQLQQHLQSLQQQQQSSQQQQQQLMDKVQTMETEESL